MGVLCRSAAKAATADAKTTKVINEDADALLDNILGGLDAPRFGQVHLKPNATWAP